jgi:hypothetical protein
MTSNDQRRFYRLNIAGVTCFLMAVLLYQSGDMSDTSFQVYLACILLFVGMLLCVKAFDTILYTEDRVEYTYEDDIENEEDVQYKDDIEDEEDIQYENLP